MSTYTLRHGHAPNNSFKPNPHRGGAWLYAFGYIHIQSPPRCGSA